ncbi:hypothetical protein BKA93DRAFT_554978 [Sparassis latifolia]
MKMTRRLPQIEISGMTSHRPTMYDRHRQHSIQRTAHTCTIQVLLCPPRRPLFYLISSNPTPRSFHGSDKGTAPAQKPALRAVPASTDTAQPALHYPSQHSKGVEHRPAGGRASRSTRRLSLHSDYQPDINGDPCNSKSIVSTDVPFLETSGESNCKCIPSVHGLERAVYLPADTSPSFHPRPRKHDSLSGFVDPRCTGKRIGSNRHSARCALQLDTEPQTRFASNWRYLCSEESQCDNSTPRQRIRILQRHPKSPSAPNCGPMRGSSSVPVPTRPSKSYVAIWTRTILSGPTCSQTRGSHHGRPPSTGRYAASNVMRHVRAISRFWAWAITVPSPKVVVSGLAWVDALPGRVLCPSDR